MAPSGAARLRKRRRSLPGRVRRARATRTACQSALAAQPQLADSMFRIWSLPADPPLFPLGDEAAGATLRAHFGAPGVSDRRTSCSSSSSTASDDAGRWMARRRRRGGRHGGQGRCGGSQGGDRAGITPSVAYLKATRRARRRCCGACSTPRRRSCSPAPTPTGRWLPAPATAPRGGRSRPRGLGLTPSARRRSARGACGASTRRYTRLRHANARAAHGIDVARFDVGDFEALPLPDGCADVIISNGALASRPTSPPHSARRTASCAPAAASPSPSRSRGPRRARARRAVATLHAHVHRARPARRCGAAAGFEQVAVDQSDSLMAFDLDYEPEPAAEDGRCWRR